jgi:hypothetical protein
VSLVLPAGIDHIVDAPHTLHEAIVMGLRWLRFEELPHDEIPPKRIWLDGDRMRDWWAKVERAREDKYKGGSGDLQEDPNATYEDNDLSLIDRG